jgi:hypothetical protein
MDEIPEFPHRDDRPYAHKRAATEKAVELGLGLRDCMLAGFAAYAAQQGQGAHEWVKVLQRQWTFLSWLMEDLRRSEATLRAAGLWPWPDEPSDKTQG